MLSCDLPGPGRIDPPECVGVGGERLPGQIEDAREHVLDVQRCEQRARCLDQRPQPLQLRRAVGGLLGLRLEVGEAHGSAPVVGEP